MTNPASIYIVTNGYLGNGAVGVLVEARDEAEAVEQASAALKQEAQRHSQYPEDYWEPECLTVKRIEFPYCLEIS